MMNSNAVDAAAAVGISPFLITSKPPDVLVNSWKETRQARAELDQCQREKAFLETQLSDEQDRNGRLERENSELEEDNATLRARLAAFEVENPLPPGWVRYYRSLVQPLPCRVAIILLLACSVIAVISYLNSLLYSFDTLPLQHS